MKRVLAMLMLVVMMCGCVGLGEEKGFDSSVFEGLNGYMYIGERTWIYNGGSKSGEETTRKLVMSAQAMQFGKEGEISVAMFFVAIADMKMLDDIKKITITCDNGTEIIAEPVLHEDMYKMYGIDLTADEKEVVQEILNADKIIFRAYQDSDLTNCCFEIEIKMEDFGAGVKYKYEEGYGESFRTAMKNIYESGALDFSVRVVGSSIYIAQE